MEKNIAALLREDTRTVKVSFGAGLLADDFDPDDKSPATRQSPAMYKAPDAKLYTYVTDLPLVVGDTVVVEAGDTIKLAAVRVVDEDVSIEPNDETKYKWVVAKVDFTAWQDNTARNQEIESAVADAYKNNLRRSFAQQILGGLDDAHRGKVAALLKGGAGNG